MLHNQNADIQSAQKHVKHQVNYHSLVNRWFNADFFFIVKYKKKKEIEQKNRKKSNYLNGSGNGVADDTTLSFVRA